MLQTVTDLLPDQRVQNILAAYFALSRVINPTRLYGTPAQIFGHHTAAMWSPADVEAVLNLNGILAHGLESFLHVTNIDVEGLNEQLRWLVQRLAFIEIPRTIYLHPEWKNFCYEVDERLMGLPMPPDPASASAPVPVVRIATIPTASETPAASAKQTKSTIRTLATVANTAIGSVLRIAAALYAFTASWAKWFAIGLAVSIFYMAWWSTGPAEWSALATKWNTISPAAQLELVRKLLHAPFPVAAAFASVMATAGAFLRILAPLSSVVMRRPAADRGEVQP
ncbi:hypothetical protein ABMY26_07400 (plasmid) [Azospirillum sp. HJ39]|uniref:hypothetical protein n=1 Tax=Azospirillum sp. HJ39 TaxID=3159496 RepID=UPI0035577E6C